MTLEEESFLVEEMTLEESFLEQSSLKEEPFLGVGRTASLAESWKR